MEKGLYLLLQSGTVDQETLHQPTTRYPKLLAYWRRKIRAMTEATVDTPMG